MNWKKFLGSYLYKQLANYCIERNVSIASVVRNAVKEYVDK